MATLKASSQWLRANVREAGQGIGVDRERNVINGYLVATEGVFLEPEPRGEFDEKSLRGIVKLMKSRPEGTKMRYGHPSLSSDALGTAVAWAKNPRLDSVMVKRNGETVELKAVRADAHLLKSSFDTPSGNLGKHLLDLAEESPGAFGSSLVLQWEEEFRLDTHGKNRVDANGKDLPPLIRATMIHASDFTDTPAANDSLLGANIDIDLLPDAIVRRGCELLDAQFPGQSREVIRARCLSWLDRYLTLRFGESLAMTPGDTDEPGGMPTDGFAVGSRVQVKVGSAHDSSHEQAAGTVVEVGGPALAIMFDSQPNKIHRWYVADELDHEASTEPTAAPDEATIISAMQADAFDERMRLEIELQVQEMGL